MISKLATLEASESDLVRVMIKMTMMMMMMMMML
jgi:hypothetical protein